MRASTTLAILLAGLLGGLPTAQALTPEAAAVAAREARDGCSGGQGRFNSIGAVERDLTGDGQPDLLINYQGLSCTNATSACGAMACVVMIFVREGSRLRKTLDTLSASVEIGPGDRPPIRLSVGPNEVSVRWNGRAFK
jgi:hypothetical protein